MFSSVLINGDVDHSSIKKKIIFSLISCGKVKTNVYFSQLGKRCMIELLNVFLMKKQSSNLRTIGLSYLK